MENNKGIEVSTSNILTDQQFEIVKLKLGLLDEMVSAMKQMLRAIEDVSTQVVIQGNSFTFGASKNFAGIDVSAPRQSDGVDDNDPDVEPKI